MRRTNKQFTEEVFRRSEELLKKRRKTCRTIGTSIAACFVFFVALGVVPNLWETGNNHTSEKEPQTEHSAENAEVGNIGVENMEAEVAIENVITDQDHDENELDDERATVQAADLMSGVVREEKAEAESVNADFIHAQMNFSVELFQQSVARSPEENTLVSPLSVSLALAMTANGADGVTKTEMEQLLLDGNNTEEMNPWFYSYVNSLPSGEDYKLSIANSIWFRDDSRLTIKKDFLQTNANYYGASAYKSPFRTETVELINHWVSLKTDGMIDEIVNKIDKDTMMYLINTVCLDAKWENPYSKESVKEGIFTSLNGEKNTVDMMCSTEYIYLKDDEVTGFMKEFEGTAYSFVALLPKETAALEEYIEHLTGEKLFNLLEQKENVSVRTVMPKFSYEYELEMKDVLKDLGMVTAFDKDRADFSNIGTYSEGNLYIDNVIHKTFIDVNENGTRAGSVTAVEMPGASALMPYKVELNRPFLYMIIDNETNLPIFMGTVLDIEG